jgi:tRNA(Arg) A34 adenosine deaminase TadA
MPDLKAIFRTLEEKDPRNVANIAGYIDDRNTFQYHVSQSENLPAAAVVFDLIGRNKMKGGKVYTNLRKAHWIYTYTSGAEGEGGNDLIYIEDANVAAMDTGLLTRGNGKVRVLAGEGASPGPVRGGGLFQAARSLHDSDAPVSYRGSNDHSRDKGLHRALRYYMLAAYALLGKSTEAGYSEGNYIAGLLVDDEGRILSYGVNSGWFHHGETNMLLHYFSDHPGQPKLPSNTILFSTLTPCKQCSKYIEATRPGDSVIFIGQEDTGGRGREGEKFGVHLSAVTDPIRNRVAKPIMQERDTGKVRSVGGAWGQPKTTERIMERVQVGEKVEKSNLETLLAQKMKEGATIAEQIGKHCGELLVESRGTFTHKHAKVRDQRLDDQLIKYQVLDYLNTWMNRVKLQSFLKQIG